MKLETEKLHVAVGMALIGFLVLAGCAHVPEEVVGKWQGQIVYNKVGIHGEPSKAGSVRLYSTNYFGTAVFYPVNTKFRVEELFMDEIILLDVQDKRTVQIIYLQKHSIMPIGDYMDKMFTKSQVEIPAEFSKKDRELLRKGAIDKGMSRKAVFMSIGYPPGHVNSRLDADRLIFFRKKFDKTIVLFDNDKISDIQE